jgi:hypothetical protein
LKHSSIDNPTLRHRIQSGERHLLELKDPSTTGFLLLGLQRRPNPETRVEDARRALASTTSPLARAWLTLALRVNGDSPAEEPRVPSPDVMLTALEALADPHGNFSLLRAAS